ncbi:glycosyltransferase family 39 protein, partial [bacterium]|nr:glycosyltransferase family 39 protein [bacterium]
MTVREKVISFLEEHGAKIVFGAAAALFLFLRLRLFFRYGLTQDEVLIISQIRTWDPVKIWHYYGFGGQGFFLQHYIFYILTLCGTLASVSYLRFICLAESFLGFYFLYKLAKNNFGSFAAFGALLIYALCPYQILYTLYIRFYALNMTLVIMELYFYFRALENEDRLAKYLGLSLLFAALAFCSHQFSVFLQPVVLFHFIIWCLVRKPKAENVKLMVLGAALLIVSLSAGFLLWDPLLKKAGLVFSTKDAWIPVKLGIASQRLQLFFWKNALPVKCCSLVFLWVSLGL